MLENFAKTTPPINPLIGQQWYDKANGRMNFYNGTEWRYYSSPESSLSSKFDMEAASQGLDFTLAATTTIFIGADASKRYCPTHLIMIPSGPFTATSPATINICVTTPGDVLSSTVIPIIASTKFVSLPMNTEPTSISGTGLLYLNVTTPASGGQLNYDVYVFGVVF
jgi:hypothetical protein